MTSRPVLHEYSVSGNCYKVRLTAALVGIPLDRREYDITRGETRTPEFLARINSNGRIPVLQIGDRFIPESNAACHYIAHGSSLVPSDAFDHADMLRWMFWEQYSHEPNIATLRFWIQYVGMQGLTELQRLQIEPKRSQGQAALTLMDHHLASRDWFVGTSISLADICLYAYTHVAGDADFDLSLYPNVVAWMDQIAGQAGYISMDA